MDKNDIARMKEAITWAEACKPISDSIPKVGAIIAQGTKVIGRGRRGTGNEGDDKHAEHVALEDVKDPRVLPGATVYTTLEPCTPEVRSNPLECCTEQLLQAKVKKVFIGILDPNQGVRGKGLWELQSRGISVELFDHESALKILALNAPFIRFQQALGVRIIQPVPNQLIELTKGAEGGWYGRCDLVCKCANEPDPSIKIIMQQGGGWWPARNELYRIGDTREWKAQVNFGADGDHTIHIVKATQAGAALVAYYQDVVNRNIERLNELARRSKEKGLPADFLQQLPGNYQGIKMGSLPQGLESLAHVQVRVVKK